MDFSQRLRVTAGLPGCRFRLANTGPRQAGTPASTLRNVLRFGALVLGVATGARAEVTFYTARVAPIFEKHCVVCHGPEKHKAGLRLDAFEHAMRGAESGAVIKVGDAKGSEILRRISLPATDDDVMPSDGKPLLSADEIKIVELWISAGASQTKALTEFPTAPVPRLAKAPSIARAPDWRPKSAEIAALEKELGLRIVPRSQVPTDGLILRTASAPGRCDDAALTKLKAIAPLIVDAELARTKVTDKGMSVLSSFENLRSLDLTRTAVSSQGVAALTRLKKLETLNLTDTSIDDSGVAQLERIASLKHVWLFGTKATVTELPAKLASQ